MCRRVFLLVLGIEDGICHFPILSNAALIKLTNSGWGHSGVLLYSGWNCVAMTASIRAKAAQRNSNTVEMANAGPTWCPVHSVSFPAKYIPSFPPKDPSAAPTVVSEKWSHAETTASPLRETSTILRIDHLERLENRRTNKTSGMSSRIHAAHPRY